MELFLAASGQDRLMAREAIHSLRSWGHQVFDWTIDPGWENPEDADPQRIATTDIEAVRNCEGLIWMVSDKPSSGAPFEVGYAHALGKPVVVYSKKVYPQKIYTSLFPQTSLLQHAHKMLSLEKTPLTFRPGSTLTQ